MARWVGVTSRLLTAAAQRLVVAALACAPLSAIAEPILIRLDVDGFSTTRFGGILDRLSISFFVDDPMPDEEPSPVIGLYRNLPYSLQYGSHAEAGIGHLQLRDIPAGTDLVSVPVPLQLALPAGDISYLELDLFDPTGRMLSSDALRMPTNFATYAVTMRYFFWLPYRGGTTPFEYTNDSVATAHFSSFVGVAPSPTVLALLVAGAMAATCVRRRST